MTDLAEPPARDNRAGIAHSSEALRRQDLE